MRLGRFLHCLSALVLVALSQAALQCASAAPPQAATQPNANAVPGWETVTTFEAEVLAEISGLAASGRIPGVFWAHNDSGGDPALHALDLEGHFLGSVPISGVKNIDWEDMAGFQHEGQSYLLIADTGDNDRKRPTVQLHVLAEPAPQADGSYRQIPPVTPAWSLTATYEDGPQDCEAIAVVPGENRVLLLNKDSENSAIYEVPLFPKRGQSPDVMAKRYVILPQVPNATGNLLAFLKAGLLGTRATGMDISRDGKQAVVLTYTDIRLFRRREKESWAEVFTQAPQVLALPSIYQPEAICFGRDNGTVYVSSEESPTPLIRYQGAAAKD